MAAAAAKPMERKAISQALKKRLFLLHYFNISIELVYKNGGHETRTGIVTFQVTIDDTGAVVDFRDIENEIAHDKAVVSRCLKKNMPRWKFHPPVGKTKTFQVKVALADRC